MRIIVLTGLTAAGKSSISNPTSSKFGIPILETGTFVYEEVAKQGLEINSNNIRQVSVAAKAENDFFFTQKLIDHARTKYEDRTAIFVSGVRAVSEVEFLRDQFGKYNVLVIGFHASQHTRFERLNNLDRKSQGGAKAAEDRDLRDFSKFIEREVKELGFGIGSVFAMADIIVSNDDRVYPFYTVEHNQFIFESVVRNFMDGSF